MQLNPALSGQPDLSTRSNLEKTNPKGRHVFFTSRNTVPSGPIQSKGSDILSLITPTNKIIGPAPPSSIVGGEATKKVKPNPEGGIQNG